MTQMEPFTTHTGRGVSLRRSSVDTDQIIPSEYLKRVSRAGFGDGLFAAWRADPGFVLNRPESEGATILVAGPDFGIGSSRQHAIEADPALRITVDLAAREVRVEGAAGERPQPAVPLQIDDYTRWRLME